MKRYKFILMMLAASLVVSCQKFDESYVEGSTDSSNTVVTRLEDGSLQVRGTFSSSEMSSVVSRATVADEGKISTGWCLVFGHDGTTVDTDLNKTYSDDSPLIQIEEVTINPNNEFVITLSEYQDIAFMRIVANLTEREVDMLEEITTWREVVYYDDTASEFEDLEDDGVTKTAFLTPPTADQVEKYGIATFGQYRYQSVGLDGLYNMTYDTKANLEYLEKSYLDVSGVATNWAVVYETTGGTGGTEGTSTVHGQVETYNTEKPDPSDPIQTGFPMASYGFVLDGGITEDSLSEMFGTTVYMIRTCSKVAVEVEEDADFEMYEIFLIGAAQESRMRSTVISTTVTDGEITMSPTFGIPEDLGGTIDYEGLTTSATSSDPIYFYPNAGGNYVDDNGDVNEDINPQYIIIHGKSGNYDTEGYYKVALKAQYPLSNESTDDNKNDTKYWSALTYDILRNTSFTVKLNNIDKPGYKTYDDAADPNSPANNISYSIVIESDDNRNEILVSKGTYYAELETSRVYVKGYMDEGIEDCYVDFTMTPSSGNTVPTVYLQASGYDEDGNEEYKSEDVVVTKASVSRSGGAWEEIEAEDNDIDDLSDEIVVVESSDEVTQVRVYFNVKGSGRLRMRIGDILKFIPVVYDRAPISMYGTIGQNGTVDNGVIVTDDHGTSWNDFSYEDVEYDEDHQNYDSSFALSEDGTVKHDNSGNYETKPELRARINPKDAGDGTAVLYLKQASDFRLKDTAGNEIKDDSQEHDEYYVEFHSQSMVEENETAGLFTTSGNNVVFSTQNLATESVDDLTISIDTDITTVDEEGGDPGWDEYFDEEITDDGQTLTLSATTIPYDYEGLSLTSYPYYATGTTSVGSDYHKHARQAYVAALKANTLVLYNNTAISTVSVTNSAGDVKTYTVNQIQYPPIYLIDASGQTTKTYDVSWGGSNDQTCVFALNIWNYDLIGTSFDYGYAVDSGSSTSSSFRNNSMTFLVGGANSTYISNYNWPSYNYYYKGVNYTYGGNGSGGDVASTSISIKDLDGDSNSKTIEEISNMGGYNEAEYIFGVVRSQESAILNMSVYWTLTITVKDKYGYTYTTKKYLRSTT